jgi:cytochrome b
MADNEADSVPVWDPLLRLFHWTLLSAFGLAWFSEGECCESLADRFDGELMQSLHVWAGYAIAGLLLWRLLWGFVGPRHARFGDFVFAPRIVLGYLRDVLTLRARRYLGHNPAGGAMIVAMLLGLLTTVISGLVLYAADKGLGPLAAFFVDSSEALIDGSKETHEVASDVTLLLVAGHLLGVVWESLLHRENLVRAMITGRKRV